jgi:hypothetical protein
MRYYIDPGDSYTSGCGEGPGSTDADGRRLPCAIRAKQAEEFAATNLQIDALYGLDGHFAGKGLFQPADLDDGVRHLNDPGVDYFKGSLSSLQRE